MLIVEIVVGWRYDTRSLCLLSPYKFHWDRGVHCVFNEKLSTVLKLSGSLGCLNSEKATISICVAIIANPEGYSVTNDEQL